MALSYYPISTALGRGPDGVCRRPEIKMVLDALGEYRQYFGAFHSNCDKVREYYFRRNIVPTPDDYDDYIRPATAMSIVDTATDHIDVQNLQIDVPPPSSRALARSERLQRFYDGVWASVKKPVLRNSAMDAFAFGVAWRKRMWKTDLWPKAPLFSQFNGDEKAYREALQQFSEKRNIAFPFWVQNVSPRRLVWDMSILGPRWVIEFYETPARDIHYRYPQWSGWRGRGDLTMYGEYWDDEYYGYFAGNEWIHGPYRHGYGALPYTMVDPASSLENYDGPPEERYQGLILPIVSILDAEARNASQEEAIIRAFAYPSMDFNNSVRNTAETDASEYVMWGGKNVLAGTVVSPGPRPPMPPGLEKFHDRIKEFRQEATYPDVIRGERPTGTRSGFQTSALAGIARLKFQGVAEGMARSIEEDNSGFAMLVENKAKGRVTVHARTHLLQFDQSIKPKDINGYYENKVTLKAESPEEAERVATLAMQLYKSRGISWYEFIRRAGSRDPLREMNQIRAEEIADSEPVRLKQAELAAKGIELEEQLIAAASGDLDGRPGPAYNPGQFNSLAQGNRVNERGIQERRLETRNQPSVFPEGMEDLLRMGKSLTSSGGGPTRVPSGQTVR